MASREASPHESSRETGLHRPRSQEAVDQFISLWGEMASTWGINRTMAKVHALLYCVERPLNTDEIMQRLDVSRGNANMNLRSLVEWDLVTKTEQADSRKDFYEAEKDVWKITARIIQKRQRQEVQPVREQLQDCADLLAQGRGSVDDLPESERLLFHRFENLIELMEMFEGVSREVLPLVQNKEVDQLQQFVRVARERRGESTDEAETS